MTPSSLGQPLPMALAAIKRQRHPARKHKLSGLNKKLCLDSLECSSPRKSLVKGERFIRQLKRNQSDFTPANIMPLGSVLARRSWEF